MAPESVDNLIEHLHVETYREKFTRGALNHETMIHTASRPRESLNGIWHFTVDPYDTGLRMDWHNLEATSGGRLPWDYDLEGGEEISVPSCWNMFKPEYFHYEGSAWYARRFVYSPKSAGERAFLRIGAANYEARVFLNGEYLGSHCGGSTPFCLELTGRLGPDNLIQVCVDNTRTLDRVPMRNTDWFNYGGIYRDVALYRLSPTFIRDLKVGLVPDGTYSRIKVEIAADGPSDSDDAMVELPGLGIKAKVRMADGRGALIMAAHPELWSPENPRLYEVYVTYGEDRVSERIGFRQIEVSGRDILLNGRRLFLRGICVHEDDPQLGKASDEADLRRRFGHAKELGCNFIRLAHYPHTELAALIADEVGMMLWEEIPVYWAIAFEQQPTYIDAENQLRELIRRDQNRASVIIWSVGNENADSDARLSFMGRLAKKAKELDPARLVSAACLVNRARLRIEDRLTDFLDVIGLNEYYGWYNPDYEELARIMENSDPGKPVIISETGADALAGQHGDDGALFTEEYMAEVYRKQLAMVDRFGYLSGICPWILYDFRSPRRQNRYQKGFNRKGLIAADKSHHKMAFYVLQDYYRRKIREN